MRKSEVSSTLTVYHDGQFWVSVVEHVENGMLSVARLVLAPSHRMKRSIRGCLNVGRVCA